MNILAKIAYFFGGASFVNAVPHFVSGVLGQPFQSPFAKPSGVGLSSSSVNVCWGSCNWLIAFILLGRVGHFDVSSNLDVACTGLGALVMALMTVRWFGRLHGGEAPAIS